MRRVARGYLRIANRWLSSSAHSPNVVPKELLQRIKNYARQAQLQDTVQKRVSHRKAKQQKKNLGKSSSSTSSSSSHSSSSHGKHESLADDANNGGLSGPRAVSGREYALNGMCHDLHVANRILEAIKQKNPSFSPKRLLDYGCGTGGALWAAMDKFDEIEAYTGVEQSSALLATAQKLCSGFSLRARWDQQMPKGGDYDLVISVDGLSSMSTKSRRAALEKIWEATDSGMIVVAVHGRRSFNVINQVRDFFISRITRQQKRRERARRDSPESGDDEDGGCGAKDGKNAPAGAIISPCPHMDQCPMQAIDKSASFQEETDDAAEADKEGTASGGEVVSASQLDAQGVRIGGETGGGSNRYTLDVLSHPSKNAKIVASPLKRGGHVVLELCTYEGSYVRATVGKSVGAAYKAAKYKNWGDEWQFQTPTKGVLRKISAVEIASAPVQPWGAKKKNAKSKDKRRERQQLQQQQQQDQKGLEPETEMRRALMMQSERQSPVSEEAQEGEEEDAYLEMMRELQGIPEDDGDYELAQAVKELETLRRQHKDDDDGADLL